MVFPKRFFLLGLMLMGNCLLAEIRILSVTERYFEQTDFKRVFEYFTGKEFTGTELILRSDHANRSGMYFEFSLSETPSSLPKGSAFILHVYRSGALDPKTYPFKIPEDTEEKKDILIGLTGEDWPSKKTRLIAWKLELRSSDQRILAQKQSFLWEHEK